MVVVEQRILVDWFPLYADVFAKRNDVKQFIGIFHSPTGVIDILHRQIEFRHGIQRLYSAGNVSIIIKTQQGSIRLIFMRRIENGSRVPHPPQLRIETQLINLTVPFQYRHVTVFLRRPVIVVP